MHQMIVDVLSELKQKHSVKVHAVVTDGGSDMAKARRLLKQSNPTILTLWCISHLLNLLFGDALKAESGMVNMKEAMSRAVSIVNWILNRQVAIGLLKKKQLELYQKEIAITQYGETRWKSYLYMIDSLLKTEAALRSIVVESRDALLAGMTTAKRTKALTVLSTIELPIFWSGLREAT